MTRINNRRRTMSFDALEDRIALSGSSLALGAQGNQAVVRDLGNFFQNYSQVIPPLALKFQADEQDPDTSGNTFEDDAKALQTGITDVTNVLANQLSKDLGSRYTNFIRAFVSGVPSNATPVSATGFPTTGSLLGNLANLFEFDPAQLINLTYVANLTTAEVFAFSFATSGQVLPTAPMAVFNTTYTATIAPLADAYNQAVAEGDPDAIASAQDAVENETRTEVFALSTTLEALVPAKFAPQVHLLITGTPGPVSSTSTDDTSEPGAPEFGSLLATLNSLSPGDLVSSDLIAGIVTFFAFI